LFIEAHLLPISALQHLAFCERQWALIHLERLWAENRLTVEGRHLHDRAHEQESESRADLRIARGLRLRSFRLGLTGVADVVEFHRCPGPPGATEGPPQGGPVDLVIAEAAKRGISLPDVPGFWRAVPVEYKRGQPKRGPYDEIQLCAQVLCLEEMLGTVVPAGALFYGRPRRRHQVAFTPALRRQTEQLAARLHELTRLGKTPPARYEKKCDSCSLLEVCIPRVTGRRPSVAKYLSEAIVEEREA
jgi:CRISPR-associated exonuclease Cas4